MELMGEVADDTAKPIGMSAPPAIVARISRVALATLLRSTASPHGRTR